MRPPGRRVRRRSSLATRISLLSVGIAVITALIAGALAVGLIHSGTGSARTTLVRLADVAQSVATSTNSGRVPYQRLRRALAGLHVPSGTIGPDGTLRAKNPLVRKTITPADIQRIRSGRDLSAVRDVGGSTVFVEGRVTGQGGIVVLQRRADAVAPEQRAIRRLLLALLIAGALAAIIGLVVAWRLARPLRRTAAAAHSLAAGNRNVTLPAEGPAEVVEVSEAVNSIAGALRQSEGRQRDFLLSVSHDLRTPLTAIAGYAESLADGVVPADETSYVGGVVLGEAKRLERLVGDLLDLARLDADDFRLDFAPVELGAFVESAGRVWSARCEAGGVSFHLERPTTGLRAYSDATRLRQVLDGLLENALRVTPAGRPIVLAVRDEGGAAVAEVRDGGPGLTDDDLGVAFDQGALYERYRGVRQVGTGLGLAIVHGLVTRLGGRIEAGHAAEGGARFTVHLPPAGPPPRQDPRAAPDARRGD